ncbi:hypothetical protein [Streptomyces griseorubiginosus]|uniref:hypothetical protein n=1 Tax=Streptomyces griseorubiginosus TaxID=67304 RepID=UPI0036E13527
MSDTSAGTRPAETARVIGPRTPGEAGIGAEQRLLREERDADALRVRAQVRPPTPG